MNNNFQQTTPTTFRPPTSGYGNGDTTGAMPIEAAGTSIDKGGMRGLGLIAVAIAEAKLKYDAVEIAEDYYDLNKRDFDNFVAVHEGAIAQTVAEAMSPTANPKLEYDLFASVPAGIAKAAIADQQWFETRRRMGRYSIGAQKRADYEFALMRTHGIVAGWNIGTRYEINYADEHNNRRFDRKIAASNIGIGIGNIVAKGLSSSVANLASAHDSLGDTIATIGNGLAAGGGYKAGRQMASERYAAVTQSGVQSDVSGEAQ
ncbi:MAG: hypothetical protein V4649_19545 [Bacteroidota bacterium]